METIHYPSPKAFLAENGAYLEQAEAANSLLLGLAHSLQEQAGAKSEVLLLTVKEEGEPLLCGLQTPGRNLIVWGDPERAGELALPIRSFLKRTNHPLPGFIGPEKLVRPFAEAWCDHRRDWRTLREMGVYELTSLRPVPRAPGRCRPARTGDLSRVVDWMTAFNLEALGEFDPQGALQNADQLIESQRLYIWEDERPVSMTAVGRPTRHGITVYYVYTPPEFRRKGYATTCVAEVSKRMLKQGFRFCTLFADLANPTSNKIYREMGYRPVEDFIEVKLKA